MKTNKIIKQPPIFTEEGGAAQHVNPLQQLKRSVLATLLWEDNAYQDGVSIANRISTLIPKCNAESVAQLAIDARTKYKLRHVPLFIARNLAKNEKSRYVVADLLPKIINRADELSEFLSIYFSDGKQPLAKCVKRGLSQAFIKFDEFALARYNQDNKIRLRDVLFLCHAKPKDKAQAKLWKRLVNNELKTPDSWEVELSKSKDKKASWERLLKEEKLGALSIIRNLRNCKQVGVDEDLIIEALRKMDTSRVLPFRFITAARYYPSLENELEEVMIKSLGYFEKYNEKLVCLFDVSGSMNKQLSAKSEATRLETACGLGILARELYSNVKIYTFSRQLVEVPNRRGFALRDAIINSQEHRDTFMGDAIEKLNKLENYDKLIVFSDEQTAQKVPNPKCENAYMVNVSNNQNGVSYRGNWHHLDGFSEAIFDYIQAIDNE